MDAEHDANHTPSAPSARATSLLFRRVPFARPPLRRSRSAPGRNEPILPLLAVPPCRGGSIPIRRNSLGFVDVPGPIPDPWTHRGPLFCENLALRDPQPPTHSPLPRAARRQRGARISHPRSLEVSISNEPNSRSVFTVFSVAERITKRTHLRVILR